MKSVIANTPTDLSGLGDLVETAVAGIDPTVSLWLVLATALVFSMQAGFLLVEAGSVRSKNTINVTHKNIADIIISGCAFLLVGAPIMFGAHAAGWLSADAAVLSDPGSQLQLLYQFAFCATAATIVSGAVAERMSFNAYLFIAAAMGLLIYPGFGSLVWGNALSPEQSSWLSDRGFLDYAGSTVVHAIGGWAALAAAITIGPRLGRFAEDGTPVPIPGHSSVLVLLGVIILAVGWIGFNAGASTPGSAEFSSIVLNTIVAMIFGGGAAMMCDVISKGGKIRTNTSITGIIGALVAITAGCAYVNLFGAMLIGIVGGLTATFGAHLLLSKAKIDDPVDAIATHGLAGLAGTLLVSVFALPEHIVTTRLEQIAIQLQGSAIAFAWAFGVTFILLQIAKKCGMLVRVSAEDEEIGLNISVHGDGFDVDGLKQLLGLESGSGFAPVDLGGERINEHPKYDHGEELSVVQRVVASASILDAERREVKKRLIDIESQSTDWLFEIDREFRITHISKKFCRTLGTDVSTMIGANYFALLSPIKVSIEEHRRQFDAAQPFENCEFDLRIPNEDPRTIAISALPILNAKGACIGHRCQANDISDLKRATDEIMFLARHDSLTGLLNRAAFESEAEQALGKTFKALIGSIDLDGFKSINDSFGHATGDHLLKMTAERIRAVVGERALISRFGGDEFVFLCALRQDDNLVREASKIGDALITQLCRQVETEDGILPIGTSLGFAFHDGHPADLDILLRRSDMALYEAKRNGRRQWVTFNDSLKEKAEFRSQLAGDMPTALRNEEFYLEFQPQVDATESTLNGFEALLRWNHPEHGRIPPNDFIEIAEESGHIVALGEWVIQEACRTAANWPAISGQGCQIAINISPIQLSQPNIVEVIQTALTESKLNPNLLEIEITESTLIGDPEQIIKILHEIRELGVRVAIDDFGTGYSSLSYLQRFPLDRIKVDRAFVRNIAADEGDKQIAEVIIQLGKTLGLNVIAEGVETTNQHDLLGLLGCDDVQGFLHSPPGSGVQALNLSMRANAGGDVRTPEEDTNVATG
ncbi:MAG: EAL domain-containing protein [Henriciella sp.]|nr:EAL domain-containing protein [Henriciella sp.]